MHDRPFEVLNPSRSRRRTYLLFWFSYAAFILYVTTLPFDFVFATGRAFEKLHRVSPHPFTGPDGQRASLSDMVQNVVLFAPLGALGLAVLSTGRTPRERTRRMALAIGVATATGFVLSATVETLQLFSAERVTSLNEVVTDTTGAALGAGVATAALAVRRRLGTRTAYAATLHELYPVMVWGTIVVLAAWHPFDTTIDVGSIAAKMRSFQEDPWRAGTLRNEGVDAIRYALFSAATAIALARLRWRRPRLWAILAGASFAVLLEFSKFFVQSRMPGMTEGMVGVVASCAAASLAVPRFWSRRRAATTLSVASVVAIAAMMLSPFVSHGARQPFALFPLRSYAAETPELAISHAAELSLAFFPLGFALAFLLVPRARLMRVTFIALGLGVLLEILQGWVLGRYPDVADAVVLTLGALAGTWAAGSIVADYDGA